MKIFAVGVVVLFVGFWMVESPDSLAGFTRDAASWAWDITSQIFESLIDYFSTVFD